MASKIREKFLEIVTTFTVLVLVALIVVLFYRGCKADKENEIVVQRTGTTVKIYEGSLTTVSRVEDAKAGVVCWVYSGYERGGIDCLPIEQTRLDR